MNRRDALAALVALPEIAKISHAPVRPTDVIVIELARHLPDQYLQQIADQVRSVFPDQRVLVCDPDTRVKVLERDGQ